MNRTPNTKQFNSPAEKSKNTFGPQEKILLKQQKTQKVVNSEKVLSGVRFMLKNDPKYRSSTLQEYFGSQDSLVREAKKREAKTVADVSSFSHFLKSAEKKKNSTNYFFTQNNNFNEESFFSVRKDSFVAKSFFGEVNSFFLNSPPNFVFENSYPRNFPRTHLKDSNYDIFLGIMNGNSYDFREAKRTAEILLVTYKGYCNKKLCPPLTQSSLVCAECYLIGGKAKKESFICSICWKSHEHEEKGLKINPKLLLSFINQYIWEN
jgi:hypothetical protein